MAIVSSTKKYVILTLRTRNVTSGELSTVSLVYPMKERHFLSNFTKFGSSIGFGSSLAFPYVNVGS